MHRNLVNLVSVVVFSGYWQQRFWSFCCLFIWYLFIRYFIRKGLRTKEKPKYVIFQYGVKHNKYTLGRRRKRITVMNLVVFAGMGLRYLLYFHIRTNNYIYIYRVQEYKERLYQTNQMIFFHIAIFYFIILFFLLFFQSFKKNIWLVWCNDKYLLNKFDLGFHIKRLLYSLCLNSIECLHMR